MPRRKKLPDIPDFVGSGRNPDKLLVQKTNPLLTLSETNLTLTEFKILDAYLGRIDSHDPDRRFIRFEKGQIEELLGVSQIKPHDLEKRINNLFQTIKLRDPNKPKGFTLIALFEKAECYQDDDGLWQIDLGASYSAMEYIFNPESLGYLRYRLKNVVDLTSRYSYILYLYFEQNYWRRTIEMGLDELKTMLRCTAETYSDYKYFNKFILKKCKKELEEKTDIRFSYEPIRKGRKVASLRFTVTKIPAIDLGDIEDIDPGQVSIVDFQDTLQQDLWEDAVQDFKFSKEQMDELREVLEVMPLAKMPQSPACQDAPDLMRYHYMCLKIAEIKRRDAKKTIRDKYAYLLKILKKDANQA